MAFETPQSSNEAILQNMLGASNEIKPPQSRVEKLLQELSGQMPEANPSEGTTTGTLERLKIGDDIYSVEGGGSGTSDYDALNNKPQIAGTTLSGNKSLADLGIASATTVSGILDGASIDSFADVETALAGKQDTLTFDSAPTSESTNPVTSGGVYTALAGKVDKTSVGVASGVAELDSNGKVPSAQLPSYVDDTVEGYLYNEKWYSDAQHTTEVAGETGKIYVELETNKTYRWSGSTFVEISESLALGETSSTAYAGNKGKANADAIAAIKDGASIDSFADVETALAGKQDTLTFDNTPTENSTNPVKSGGIYSALAGKADTGIVADDFDSTASYVIGNYCIENGKLYRFKANHSGAWSASDVDEIQITGELATLKSGLTPEEKFCVVNSEVVEDNNRVVIYKVGRVVFVTMSYAPKSGTIVSGAIIVSQLPTPIQAWQIFDGISQLILDTDGSLKFWYPSDTTIGRRDFTFSYVTAS